MIKTKHISAKLIAKASGKKIGNISVTNQNESKNENVISPG